MKLQNACFGTAFFITVSELGMVGSSISSPIMIPFSGPISVALTASLSSLRSTSGLITKKNQQTLKNWATSND